MVDHHTVARQFMLHEEREMKAGRTTHADWSWIVPPLSGSTTPSSIEIQLLLQPICDEGRIPQLPTLAELIEAGEASGFASVFHKVFENEVLSPNFYHQPAPWRSEVPRQGGCPFGFGAASE